MQTLQPPRPASSILSGQSQNYMTWTKHILYEGLRAIGTSAHSPWFCSPIFLHHNALRNSRRYFWPRSPLFSNLSTHVKVQSQGPFQTFFSLIEPQVFCV